MEADGKLSATWSADTTPPQLPAGAEELDHGWRHSSPTTVPPVAENTFSQASLLKLIQM